MNLSKQERKEKNRTIQVQAGLLPSALNVMGAVSARQFEIKAMEQAIANGSIPKVVGNSYLACEKNEDGRKMGIDGVSVKCMNNDFVKFSFTGPKSHTVLANTLTLAQDKDVNTEAHILWNRLRNLGNSASLPAGVVLALTIEDPRICLPKSKAKSATTDFEYYENILEWPNSVSESRIHDTERNALIYESKVSNAAINQRRSENVIPGTPLDPLPSDSKIPILLIHRGTMNNRGDSKRLEVNFGWDLIAPKGWGMPLWNLFTFGGSKVGGLRDLDILHFESGLASFPTDYPETETYEFETKIKEKIKQSKYKRTPKLYRFDYTKTNFKHPFAPNFRELLGIEAKENLAVIHSQRLIDMLVDELVIVEKYPNFDLFGMAYLDRLKSLLQQRSFASELKAINIETVYHLYVRVKVILDEGAVEENSAICLPHSGSVLDEKLDIKNVIGYVTTGGFQISLGKSAAIGCCTLHGIYRFYHGQHHRINSLLREMFLPIGYPKTVHRAYRDLHIWQFTETLAGSIITVMTAEAMLNSVGAATPLAAGGASLAIRWALKDGFGEIGKLIFIQNFSYSFDSHPKTWKIVGEIASVIGAGLQILTIFFPQYFLILASFGIALRGIHYSIWSATHITFNNHSSVHGNNIGDLVSKDDAQLSLAHLLGLGTGVSILTFSHSPLLLVAVYGVLSICQLAMSFALVKAANFEVLNLPRMQLIAKMFVEEGEIYDYKLAITKEHWIGEYSTEPLIKLQIPSHFSQVKDENYLLAYDEQADTFWMILSTEGNGKDILKAVLHATKWKNDMGEFSVDDAFVKSYEWSRDIFPMFYGELASLDWDIHSIVWSDKGLRISWKKNH
ncbi:hypothetical protein HDV06_002141 [Boothiomyces sp. JEL0866]|nr:hypothetical protein HDV06_002141 [Boothiomyces sp. JEL0866]